MYRDAQTSLDERDRAVGAILIGEALIAACERARVLGETHVAGSWRAIRDAHDDFPEIWRSLDRARAVLARRGVNVTGYDELRPHVRTRLATAGDDVDAVHLDPAALEDARRAAGELKNAVPGADWAAIDERTAGLVQAPLLRRQRTRLIGGGLITLFAIAVMSWAAAIVPHRKPDRAGDLRRGAAQIALQRRVKIVALTGTLGDRCDAPRAHELAKELVMDGRGDDARRLATTYAERCGEDAVLVRWAHAPRP